MSVDYLATVAEALLDAGVDALVEATTGHAPPSKAYLCTGPPTGDYCCDGGEIAVWLERAVPLDPGIASSTAVAGQIPQFGCVIVWEATFVVSVHRCYPSTSGNGAAPAVDTIDAASTDLLVDLWALLTEFTDRLKNETLIPGTAGQNCRNVTLDVVEPADDGPLGACAGWELRVIVRLNDHGPVGS